MPLSPGDIRIWVPGIPKSEQSDNKHAAAYVARIRDAARKVCPNPVFTNVEVTILFKDWTTRPDVDNVIGRILDSLENIVYMKDRQVTKITVAVVGSDIAPLVADHLTIQRVLAGEGFLIQVLIAPVPSISWQLESS